MSVSVKLETCPKCQSKKMENLVRVEAGQHVKVYVRCLDCQTFVARYTLERYTSDKPYESLLKNLRGQSNTIGTRELAREIEAFSQEIEKEFTETSRIPAARLRVEEMIIDSKTQED
jgi:hypothetical protein